VTITPPIPAVPDPTATQNAEDGQLTLDALASADGTVALAQVDPPLSVVAIRPEARG